MKGTNCSLKSANSAASLAFAGGRLAFLAMMGILLLGGLADWTYLNSQEGVITLAGSFVEYLSSYSSAFLIAGIELGAAYYFFARYDLGSSKRILSLSLGIGILGFVGYVLGEVLSGLSGLGNSIPFLTAVSLELSPNALDYGNALIILASLFGLVLLVATLLKINPLPKSAVALSKGAGVIGGVWTSAITTFAAMVCCGPLPGVIALATGISSLYFTTLISLQSLLVLVSVPLLFLSIFLADKRARKGCKLKSY